MKFSANLGFLWNDLPLPQAIRAAKAAGFDAVECHFPYDVPPADVAAALAETGLAMLGLNTRRGDTGENGLSALVDQEDRARAAIDEAIAYAQAIKVRHIHVMAGVAEGRAANACFARNLRHACAAASPHGLTILIEPLNKYDAPGYFLKTVDQAIDLIQSIGAPNLKLMFDCYHAQLTGGDVSNRLRACLPWIGHIQFASVPDRGPPDHGELAYDHIFNLIDDLGYDGYLGAEYRPVGQTESSLGWLTDFRKNRRA